MSSLPWTDRLPPREAPSYDAIAMLAVSSPHRKNEHHTLPRSCGGSDGDGNVTKMNIDRHAEFHDTFAWNRTPLTLSRLIALLSVGYQRVMMHPDQMEDLFAETTLPRWHRLYEDDAIANNWRPEKQHLRARMNVFLTDHAREELYTVDQVESCLENGGHLPWQTSRFLPSALRFFDTQNPVGAMMRMHTETAGDDLAWTKCLRQEVRHGILELFQERKVPFDRGCKRDLRTVLFHQRERLERCIVRWERDAQLAVA